MSVVVRCSLAGLMLHAATRCQMSCLCSLVIAYRQGVCDALTWKSNTMYIWATVTRLKTSASHWDILAMGC